MMLRKLSPFRGSAGRTFETACALLSNARCCDMTLLRTAIMGESPLGPRVSRSTQPARRTCSRRWRTRGSSSRPSPRGRRDVYSTHQTSRRAHRRPVAHAPPCTHGVSFVNNARGRRGACTMRIIALGRCSCFRWLRAELRHGAKREPAPFKPQRWQA